MTAQRLPEPDPVLPEPAAKLSAEPPAELLAKPPAVRRRARDRRAGG